MNPTPNYSTPTGTEAPASSGSLAVAWLFVGIPLIWGVSQTFLKALTLFK